MMASIWLEQLIAACDGIGDSYDGERAACNYVLMRWLGCLLGVD
ncbi:hypothetical protein [Mycolicibacterium sp. P9-64]|nr:hypothetical protein [Mycolicibacterium sp. P9-64]